MRGEVNLKMFQNADLTDKANLCESEIMQKEVGVRQRGNRGGSDCVSCLREGSVRPE